MRELIDWLNACGYPVQRTPYPTWRRAMLSRGDVQRQTILDAVGPLLALQISEDVAWLGRIPHISNRYTQASLKGLVCPAVDAPTLRTYVEHLQQTGFLPIAE